MNQILRRQTTRSHYGSKVPAVTVTVFKYRNKIGKIVVKQRSTKHTHKTNDRVAGTPLNTGGELMQSGRVSSSYSTSGTRRVNLVTNPLISRE